MAFGLIAIFWPGITVLTLTFMFGAYALAYDILAIGAALMASGAPTASRWWLRAPFGPTIAESWT